MGRIKCRKRGYTLAEWLNILKVTLDIVRLLWHALKPFLTVRL
jgi:hypothetical protein